MSDDNTIIEGLSNDQIAENAKLESKIKAVYRKLPFTKNHTAVIADVADASAEAKVSKATKRIGERIGAIEDKITELSHGFEMTDQAHTLEIQGVKDDVATLEKNLKSLIGIVGFILMAIISAVAAFK